MLLPKWWRQLQFTESRHKKNNGIPGLDSSGRGDRLHRRDVCSSPWGGATIRRVGRWCGHDWEHLVARGARTFPAASPEPALVSPLHNLSGGALYRRGSESGAANAGVAMGGKRHRGTYIRGKGCGAWVHL